jgi:D-sedoheptulose 7-phosphate isomerase
MVLSNSQSIVSYFADIELAIKTVEQNKFEEVIKCIVSATISQHRIWIIGNGGSAATASHFAADLMRQTNQRKIKVRAICLSESTARITAIGNDYTFDDIFARQIWSLADKEDVIISLSASGNSPNLVEGIRRAKAMGLRTISFVGFQGGVLKAESELVLHFPTTVGAYEIAEDTHSIVCHYIAMQVRRRIEDYANSTNFS